MDRVAIIIPAKYYSGRLPGKPLSEICGKPMIQWVYEASARVAYTTVATDDHRIYSAVRAFGGNVTMTSTEHKCGTDRVHEVAETMDRDAFDVFVNVQVDEPLIDSNTIANTAALVASKGYPMATAASVFQDETMIHDRGTVKVVVDKFQRAMWFSRLPIPHSFDKELVETPACFRHVGIYAFTRESLRKFSDYPRPPHEISESLEQLRAIYNGLEIGVVVTDRERDCTNVGDAFTLDKARTLMTSRLFSHHRLIEPFD